jgi:hypothetical protein
MELQKELGIEKEKLLYLNTQLRAGDSIVEIKSSNGEYSNLKIEFPMIENDKVKEILAVIKPFIE